MSLNIAAVRREVLWMLVAAALGLLLLPPMVWLAGSRVFGPYAGGGTRDLVDHYFQGLREGQQAFWIIALGPYLGILTLRLTRAAVRALRAQA
jgi:hypothetical protein